MIHLKKGLYDFTGKFDNCILLDDFHFEVSQVFEVFKCTLQILQVKTTHKEFICSENHEIPSIKNMPESCKIFSEF